MRTLRPKLARSEFESQAEPVADWCTGETKRYTRPPAKASLAALWCLLRRSALRPPTFLYRSAPRGDVFGTHLLGMLEAGLALEAHRLGERKPEAAVDERFVAAHRLRMTREHVAGERAAGGQ